MGHSRPLFRYFRLFNTQLTVNKCSMYKINLPMTGFKPRTSGIGSDHSTNWATTTARITLILFPVISNNRQKLLFKNCHRLDSNLIPLRRNVCSRKILVEYTAKFPFTCQPYKKHILYKSPSKVCLRSRMRERERDGIVWL